MLIQNQKMLKMEKENKIKRQKNKGNAHKVVKQIRTNKAEKVIIPKRREEVVVKAKKNKKIVIIIKQVMIRYL